TAQAELLKAKKNALDTTNQVVDAKLKAQEAIVKQRHSAIEHKEKEHQQRMVMLQKNAINASANESLLKAKLDKELQLTINHQQRMIQQAQMHEARMKRMNSYSVLDRSSQYMFAGTMYYTVIRGAREAINVIKDFEYNLVNVKRIMGDSADVAFVKESMMRDAKEYGYALKEVGDVYT